MAIEAEAEGKATGKTDAEAEAEAKASAKAAADAKETPEAMRLMQEAGEPEWAPLKAMGERKVSNHLADYGEDYSVSED